MIVSRKESKIYFCSEQDGKAEQDFKSELTTILLKEKMSIRAYLVQIKYHKNDKHCNVALCFRSGEGMSDDILNQSTKLFKSMFNRNEYLDILFITQPQEVDLRKICCPFFTSNNYRFSVPDFFLTSHDSYQFQYPIACYKNKKLYGEHPDGYMLCDIDSFLLEQNSRQGSKDINQIVLANRHENYSLFVIEEWPFYVHVAIPLVDFVNRIMIDKTDIEGVAWGEVYPTLNMINKTYHDPH